MTQITLTLTPELADTLSSTACECFLNDQPNRFEHVEANQVPFGDEFDKGTMFWCGTASDALLLLAYERAQGFNALLLWDLADAADAQSQSHTPYVVMSSRKWVDCGGD